VACRIQEGIPEIVLRMETAGDTALLLRMEREGDSGLDGTGTERIPVSGPREESCGVAVPEAEAIATATGGGVMAPLAQAGIAMLGALDASDAEWGPVLALTPDIGQQTGDQEGVPCDTAGVYDVGLTW